VGGAECGYGMCGSEHEVLYELVDLESGLIAGVMRGDGVLVDGDDRVRELIARAFAQEAMVRDGRLVEELGVCFIDVETLRPGDPGHAKIVLQNLGRLAGYLPRPRQEPDSA
jgi:hypothetical protein